MLFSLCICFIYSLESKRFLVFPKKCENESLSYFFLFKRDRNGKCWVHFSVNLVEIITFWNKDTLTGPANCKKTTRHHAHQSLCAKSRKTDDAKSRKWPKTSISAIFGQIRGQISPNRKSFRKIGFVQIEGLI